MNIIDKILNRFGYSKQHTDFTEDELALMMAQKLNDITDEIDAEYEKKIFSELKNTDGLVQYLREAANRDIKRYFGAATKEEQLIIRGSFARTSYLKTKIKGADKEERPARIAL